jgi:arabinogalactan oligomer/maltooligosaccharide transport system permease protein
MAVQAGSAAAGHRRRKIDWIAYAYLAPALLTMAVLSLAPIVYNVVIAFTNFNQMHFQSYQFVGFANFKALFTKDNPMYSVFIPTLIWTFVWAVSVTGLCYLLGLVTAVLLNQKEMRESVVYRAVLIIPWAVPSLITMLAWQGLLNDSYGQVNMVLKALGIHPVPWQTSPFWARVSMILVNVWAGFPYMMTVCLGALQAVPTELYEAAEVEGAGVWQRFRYITMPSVWRTTLPLVIPSFAFNFNNFNASYLLTGGGPPRSDNPFVGYTDILASAAYKMTLNFNRYDLAATVSIVLFIIVGILSWLNMRLTGAFKEADA